MKYILYYGLLLMTSVAHASSWGDAWRNTNQRAAALLENKQFEQAEKTFTRPDWQAVAAFRGQHYVNAAKGFQAQENAEGYYNQGNALAFQGDYKQAIAAYDKALKLQPNHPDAEYNRALLKDMLKDEPPESPDSNNSNNSNNSNDDNSDGSGNDENNSKNASNSSNPNHDQSPKDGSNNTQNKSEPRKPQENTPESTPPSEPEPESESEPGPESQENTGENTAKNAQQSPENSSKPPEPSQHASAEATEKDKKDKEQWLRIIPDDPGGLLREKFWRDHMRRMHREHS